MGLEGLGFPVPPLSAGLLGIPPGDPMLLGLGQLPGMAAISEAAAEGQQQPATSVPAAGEVGAFPPGSSAEGVGDGAAATVPPAGLPEGAVVQGEVMDPAGQPSITSTTATPGVPAPWTGKEEDLSLQGGEIPLADPGSFAAPQTTDGHVAAAGIGEVGSEFQAEVPALDPATGILVAPPLGVDPSGIESEGVKLEGEAPTSDTGAVLGEAIPPLPVAAGGEYAGQTDVERVAIKVYGRTPENMSAEERQKFTEWISTAPIMTDATTKAGCVHMTQRVSSNQRFRTLLLM